MNDLQTLINLVARVDTHDVAGDILSNSASSMVVRLYYGLQTGTYANEIDAKQDLFPRNFNQTVYSRAKAELRDDLINIWFALSNVTGSEGEESVSKARLFCSKGLSAIWELARSGHGYIAKKTMRKIVSLATKFQLTKLCSDAHHLLAHVYTTEGDIRLMKSHMQKAIELSELHMVELEASAMVMELYAGSFKKSNGHYDLENLESIENRFMQLPQVSESFQLRRDMYRGLNYIAQAKRDYKTSIELTRELQDFYNRYPQFSNNSRLAETHIQMANSHFHLGEYYEGREEALEAVSLRPEGTKNWLIACQHLFANTVHLGEIEEALSLVNDVLNSDSYHAHSASLGEKWKLYKVIMDLVNHQSCDSLLNNDTQYDLSQKDLTGHNLLIIALEVISLIRSHQLEALIDKRERYLRYNTRYFAKKNKRTYLFMKCIDVLIREAFDVQRIESAAEPYLKKMTGKHADEVELSEPVPYTLLWDLILRQLKESQTTSRVYRANPRHRD